MLEAKARVGKLINLESSLVEIRKIITIVLGDNNSVRDNNYSVVMPAAAKFLFRGTFFRETRDHFDNYLITLLSLLDYCSLLPLLDDYREASCSGSLKRAPRTGIGQSCN